MAFKKGYKSHRKGLSYEEEYGKEKAMKIKEKLRIQNTGKKLSKETKIKIGLKSKGRHHTEESKEKLRLINLGRKHTKESKLKMSEIRLKRLKEGKIKTPIRLGYKTSELTKRKLSCVGRGIKLEEWDKFIDREPYDQRWDNVFKRRIRKRDNYICMVCGVHQEKLNKTLSVHHINYNKLLSIPQNCISLCLSCHSKTNSNRKHWTKFLQDLMSERYNYVYENQDIKMEIVN